MHCTDNTLRVFDLLGAGDPGLRGRGDAAPARRLPDPARGPAPRGSMHGRELPIPRPRSVKQARRAVEFLVETYLAATDPIALVPVGPLTNIALAIKLEPRIVERIPQTVDHGRRPRDREHDAVRRVQHLGRSGGRARRVRGRPPGPRPRPARRDPPGAGLGRRLRAAARARARRPATAAADVHRGADRRLRRLQPMDTARQRPGPRRPVRRLPRRPDGRDRPAGPRRRRDPRRADARPDGHRHRTDASGGAQRVRRVRRRRAEVRRRCCWRPSPAR